jgi:hypothetical protein
MWLLAHSADNHTQDFEDAKSRCIPMQRLFLIAWGADFFSTPSHSATSPYLR